MMDIPTEEGQDTDIGLVAATTTPRGAGGAGGAGGSGGAGGAGGEEGATADIGLVGSLEPARDDFIGQILLQQMGAGRSYVRERQQAVRRILISEIYSPPRITKEATQGKWKHIAPGFALDLTVNDPSVGMPWDFSQSGKHRKAPALLRK